MNEALYVACGIAYVLAIPLLLTTRTLRPRRMPWWLVIILAAVIGWILFPLHGHFYRRYVTELESMPERIGGDAAPAIIDWYVPPAYYGALLGLSYLALCLVPYWALFARRRTRAPNDQPPN